MENEYDGLRTYIDAVRGIDANLQQRVPTSDNYGVPRAVA